MEIKEINKVKSENLTEPLAHSDLKDWDFTFYANEYNLRMHDAEGTLL